MIKFTKFFSILAGYYYKVLFTIVSDPKIITKAWQRRGILIGEDTYIYKDVKFGRNGRDPIVIGTRCVLTGCTILGHDASTNRILGKNYGGRSMVQPVVIEDDCFIGYNSIVLMGVTIGKGSIVGAGAVVTRNVPPGSVVAGNPAKVIETVAGLVEKRKQLCLEHPEYFPGYFARRNGT